MARFIRKGSKKAGQVPGTPVYVGKEREAAVTVSRFEYDADDVTQDVVGAADEAASSLETPVNSWINVDGVHDVEKIQRIGACFDLHPLAIEDIVHTGQRPKVEDYDSHLFIVLRMLRWRSLFSTRSW